MSTASRVTALAELDPTLGDDAAIVTQIFRLIAIQGDGTHWILPGEEDAIKLCIGLGQEHPEGVLQISDTETILVFSSGPSMMAASQHFAVATTWPDELVQLCFWPPTTMLVRDYIAATSSHPSGALTLAQGKEVET